MITQAALSAFLGKSISQICPNRFNNAHDNHCAHFVSHAMGYTFGVTCHTMAGGTGAAANIRVQEVFPQCLTVGTWASKPANVTECLVFITRASNVNLAAKTMQNVPRKHVGILMGGFVWHYSNTQGKVVKQTPADFSHHYAAPDNAMFFGTVL